MCGTTWNASNNNKLSCHLQCPRVCACMCVDVCVLEFCLACSKPVALLMMAATERERGQGVGRGEQFATVARKTPWPTKGITYLENRTFDVSVCACVCVCFYLWPVRECASVCMLMYVCVCVYLIRRHSSCCSAYHLAAFTARPKFD